MDPLTLVCAALCCDLGNPSVGQLCSDGGRANKGAYQAGLIPVEYDDSEHTLADNRSVKRKLGEAGLEIPDSDDDYGWDPDDDAHLPPEPPQWQGSEDLIVGTQRSDDEAAEGDEGEDKIEGVGTEEDVPQQACG